MIKLIQLYTHVEAGLVTTAAQAISMFNVDTHCDVSVGVGQDLKLVFVAQEELIRLLNVNGRPSILLFCILRHLINKKEFLSKQQNQEYNVW
jgi:hypothetical protein